MYNILLVDDEEKIAHNMKKTVENYIGHEVCIYISRNGLECLELIKSVNIDLFIIDICMPGMNGVELIEHLREREQSVPIVVVSAHANFKYAQELIPFQIKKYLLKPIEVSDLLNTIKEIMCMENEKNELQKVKETKETFVVGHKYVEAAENYIKENLYESISLADVAEALFVNKSYLSDLFKKAKGTNINLYILQLKVEEAKHLLIETHYSVNEISEQLGYSSAKYFIKKFSSITGVTPAKFRKMLHEVF